MVAADFVRTNLYWNIWLGRTFKTVPTGRIRPKSDIHSMKAVKDRIETEGEGTDKTSLLNCIYASLKTPSKAVASKALTYFEFEKNLFLSRTREDNAKEKTENMSESRTRELDQEVLGFFRNSFSKRYEKWKRKDLILIALQTMPKQVGTQQLFDNLTKLKTDFEKRLEEDEESVETRPE
jgi:hypothetical protein